MTLLPQTVGVLGLTPVLTGLAHASASRVSFCKALGRAYLPVSAVAFSRAVSEQGALAPRLARNDDGTS